MGLSDLLADFKLEKPDIKLNHPHAISVHIGWLNWGNVGSITFNGLVNYLHAEKLAELERSGDFYDTVNYRGYSRTYVDAEGNRHMEFPNSRVYYAKRQEPLNDIVLLYLLEPNHFGEFYVERVVSLMKRLGVERYETVGAMGNTVPHTRPIIINARSSDPELNEEFERLGLRENSGGQYQGPTSIFNLIAPRLQNEGIATASLIAHLPSYTRFDDGDYAGVLGIAKVISEVEKLDMPLGELEINSARQHAMLDERVSNDPRMMVMIQQLEEEYDRRQTATQEDPVKLSDPIEDFLSQFGDKMT